MKCGWNLVRICFAEVIGASIYIFLGCLQAGYTGQTSNFILGIVFGSAMLMVLQAFETISGGHASPCVTIGAIILKKTKWDEGLLYIVMQLIGSFIGYGVAYGIHMNDNFQVEPTFCLAFRRNEIDLGQAVVLEFLGTVLYMLVWCQWWKEENELVLATFPIYISLALSGMLIASNTFTGCTFFPFRALVPAIFSNNYEDIWIYLVMPIVAAVLVALIFRLWDMWKTKDEEQA